MLVDENGRVEGRDDVFAAGDVARFPATLLGGLRRVEHENHATTHGRYVGANMAGADTPYDYLPFFYSDLFDLGYEAVGDVDSRLDTVVEWAEPNRKGVVCYVEDDKPRGFLLWDVWDRVDARADRRGPPGATGGAACADGLTGVHGVGPLPPDDLIVRTGVSPSRFVDVEARRHRFDEIGRDVHAFVLALLTPDWNWSERLSSTSAAARADCSWLLPHAEDGAKLTGCDIHEPSIRWLRDHFPEAVRLYVNDPEPGLPDGDDAFDLVCAVSVFTHLTNWAPWLLELGESRSPAAFSSPRSSEGHRGVERGVCTRNRVGRGSHRAPCGAVRNRVPTTATGRRCSPPNGGSVSTGDAPSTSIAQRLEVRCGSSRGSDSTTGGS